MGTRAHRRKRVWLVAGVLLLSAAAPAQTSKTARRHTIPSDEALAARAISAAEAAMEKQDWAAAESGLRDVVAQDSTNYRAWFDLGFVLSRTDRRPQAIAAYRKSVAAKPDVFESNLNLGMLLLATGSDEAPTFLRAATRLKPSQQPEEGLARAWGILGDALMEKDPAGALAAYREASKLAPKDPRPHLAAAGLLERQGDLGAAESEVRTARELQPDSSEAQMALAELYLRAKRWPEAEASLRELLKANPANTEARFQLGRLLLQQGRKPEGVAELETVVQQSSDPAAERELAAFYLDAKQYEPAEAHYRRLLARDPGNAGLHHALGITLNAQKKFAEAETELLAAVQADPELKEAYFDLALAAQRNQHYALTIRALDARTRFYPESPGTYFMRAIAYDSLKDFPRAVENYRQFLQVANGKYPDEEWKARHRLKAIEPK